MTIEQYLYIIEIADTQSFSQAARNLYVSQPNLSYAVKQLEQKLGHPVFHRTSSGVFPTEEGAELIERFRFLKREHDMIEELLDSRRTVSRLSLKVATLNLVSASAAFTTLTERYYKSPIDFVINDYMTLSEVMANLNKMDFALIGLIMPYVKNVQSMLYHQGIEYHPIADVPIYAMVGANNPLYGTCSTIQLDELAKYTLLQITDSSEDPQQSIVHALGLPDRCSGRIRVNNWQTFFRLLQTTSVIGIEAVNPEKFAQVNNVKDIHFIKIEGCDLLWQAGWIKNRRIPLSDIGAEFLRLVQSVLRSMKFIDIDKYTHKR